jgi:F-type H+-transporting ATPase subunit b
MPQLEQFDTYLSQVVWLVISFAVLYFVMWKAALPRVGNVLQERQKRIDDDLERAEKLKSEAEAVLVAYEESTAKAHAEAQAILRAGAEAFAADAAVRHDELSARLAEETEAAESRIAAARNEALANVRTVAGEVAQAAASKLIGAQISETDAADAVGRSMEERG